MLRAIIAGERGPEILAQKARTRMRRKIAQLRAALDCSFFTGDHAFVLQMKLGNMTITSPRSRITHACEGYSMPMTDIMSWAVRSCSLASVRRFSRRSHSPYSR